MLNDLPGYGLTRSSSDCRAIVCRRLPLFCRYVKEKGSIFMNHSEPIRNARSLGIPKMLILGLQHMFAMFGATVLVPILVQSYGLPLSIQTTLLFAGIGTLFFHVCTKLKVPAFWAPLLPIWVASRQWPT